MLACHAGGPGSIPGQCNFYFFIENEMLGALLFKYYDPWKADFKKIVSLRLSIARFF